jgi:DNA-binding transcriptional regulator YiaG
MTVGETLKRAKAGEPLQDVIRELAASVDLKLVRRKHTRTEAAAHARLDSNVWVAKFEKGKYVTMKLLELYADWERELSVTDLASLRPPEPKAKRPKRKSEVGKSPLMSTISRACDEQTVLRKRKVLVAEFLAAHPVYLRQLREMCKLSEAHMAALVPVGVPSVRDLEGGKMRSLKTVLRIFRAYASLELRLRHLRDNVRST